MQIKVVHSEADGDPAEAAGVAVILTTPSERETF